jgi:hypothetical protein
VRDFLLGLKRLFNLAILVKDDEVKIIAKRDVLTDTEQIDWRERCLMDYDTEPEEYTGATFFSQQDSTDSLTKEPNVAELAPTLTGTVDAFADLPGSPAPGDTYRVRDTNLVYVAGGTGVWQPTGFYLFPVEIGDGAEGITSLISTTQTTNEAWHGGFFWRIPYVNQIGNSDTYYQIGVPFAPRLLFYRGLVEDDAGSGPYPMGAADDRQGTYNYSLHWHGEKGLYEKWYRTWYDMLATARVISYPLLLGIDDILGMQWDKKHRVRTEEGEILCLVRELRITIGTDGMEVVNAEMIRV